MSKGRRFELWSDLPFADPPGTRLAFLPRDRVVTSAIRTQDVDGTDTLELGMDREAFGWSQVGDRCVIGTLLEDGQLIWHRVERKIPERQPTGARIGSVVGRSILLDLDNALMTRAEGDGTTHATYPLRALTVDELMDLMIELTPVQFVKGSVDLATKSIESFPFDIDSPLSALQRLAEVAELELAIRGDGETPYLVDLVEQIGASASVPEFRYAKNLLAIQRISDSAKLANIVYAFGVNEGGIRAGMGDHLWTVESVTTVDTNTVDVVLVEDDVIAVDDALNGRGVRRIRAGAADVEYLIEDSTRSTRTLRVTDDVGGGAPAIVAGDFLRFLVNPPTSVGIFDGNLVPDGDVDTTGWTTAPLYSKIDDGDTPDTGDYIETTSTSLTFETKDCEVSLANPGATVDPGSIHRLKIYVNTSLDQAVGSPGTWTANLTLALYKGSTFIASYYFRPSDSGYAWVTYDLGAAEIAAIGGVYTDLRIRLTAKMKVDFSGDTVYIDVAAAHLKIIADLGEEPQGDTLIYVEDPASQASYGAVRARVEHSDISYVANLVSNPALKDWTGGVPDGWDLVGSPTITRETSPRYTRFGGSSAKYGSAAADLGLQTEDIEIFPTETAPYFSAFVVVWDESVDGLRFYVEWDVAPDTFRSPILANELRNDWDVLVIAGLKIPTDATTMRLVVLANGTSSTPWYLDAALLVQAGVAPDNFIEGRSANILWQRAVRELRRRSRPAVSYQIQAKDLTAVDPSIWPHDALTLGGNIRIIDRDMGVSETLRLMRIRRDLLTGADVQLDVESFGEL